MKWLYYPFVIYVFRALNEGQALDYEYVTGLKLVEPYLSPGLEVALPPYKYKLLVMFGVRVIPGFDEQMLPLITKYCGSH